MSDRDGGSSAWRRRQRRLRSVLRHVRQIVAVELAALHHSRDVGPAQHVGLRAQKTANSPIARLGVLKDPEPQGLTVDDAPRAVLSVLVVRPKMLGIMAGTDQKNSYAVHPFRDAEAFSHGPKQVVDIPFVTQRLIPMVMVILEISQLLVDKVVDAPIMQVVPVARVSQVLVVKITVVIPQLRWTRSFTCPLCASRRHPCRDAEAVSHGPGLCRP